MPPRLRARKMPRPVRHGTTYHPSFADRTPSHCQRPAVLAVLSRYTHSASAVLPLAPWARDCFVSRARLLVPRTTVALAGPCPHSEPPGAPQRGPRHRDGSLLENRRGITPRGSQNDPGSWGNPGRVRARASLISVAATYPLWSLLRSGGGPRASVPVTPLHLRRFLGDRRPATTSMSGSLDTSARNGLNGGVTTGACQALRRLPVTNTC